MVGMVSRRRILELTGASLAAIAGCTESDPPAQTRTETGGTESAVGTPPTDNTATTVTTVPEDLGEWTPAWTLDVDYEHALALDTDTETVYATLSDEGGPSAVAALDVESQSVDWETEFEGEAVAHSHVERDTGKETWGVTVTDDALYTVNGRDETADWTRLHAVNPDTGKTRWSVGRKRKLSVRGVRNGTVVATGLEFFEPEHSHDTPSSPLSTVVYGIDAATGEVNWSQEFTGVVDATTGPGGAYVATTDGLAALSLDGKERWSVAATARAVVPLDDVVVLATDRGRQSTLRGFTPDGTEQWTATLSVDSFLPDGDRLYALGRVTAAVTADGDVAWQVGSSGKWPLLAPDGETLYSRAGRRADAVDAFALPEGTRRFQFDTPSNNGWPLAATADVVVAEAITPEKADFTSLFAVDGESGEPLAVYRPQDSVFSAEGLDSTVYAGIGGSVLAFERP